MNHFKGGFCDISETHHLVCGADFNGFLGHTENDTGCLVLRDGVGAGLTHVQQTGGAVVSHSGQNRSDGILAGVLGDGVKQHLDAGLLATHGRTVLERDVVVGAGSAQQHVQSSRGDQDTSGHDTVAVVDLQAREDGSHHAVVDYPAFYEDSDRYQSSRIRTWLGVPLTVGEQALGVIALQSYTTPRLYTERHRDLLRAAAGQAAPADRRT